VIKLAGRDGIQLAADVLGPQDGPPVVLLHGGGQTRHAWGTTLQSVADRGWRGYSVDLRGHGDSDWDPDGDYTLDAFADDVAAIANGLPSQPVLIGASLGGIASLTAIGEAPADHPVGRALVLVDVAPRSEQAGVQRIGAFMIQNIDGFDSLEQVADAIASYNPHRTRPTNLEGLKKNVRQRDDGRWYWHWDPRFVGASFKDAGVDGGSIEEELAARDETRSVLQPNRLHAAAEHTKVPVLLVRGRMSDLLSEEGARELLEIVPHAQYADVAGAGHMVAGDRNDLFNDAVVSFLEEVRNS
jgi:pimeloyl-ACP methyl ester carboxylesterase